MKSFVRLLLAATTLLITAHRLPAPILEETTPTPKSGAKDNATPKTKRKANESSESKTSRSSFARFEGVWSGTVTSTATATFLFSSTGSSSTALTIRVSKSGAVTYANQQPVQGWLSADGSTLNWNLQVRIDDTMTWHQTCSLQLTGQKSATYFDQGRLDGGIAGGGGNSNGTLYRR
jgi:hypothetical protein